MSIQLQGKPVPGECQQTQHRHFTCCFSWDARCEALLGFHEMAAPRFWCHKLNLLAACPEGFAQFDHSCFFVRDLPYYSNYAGNDFAAAESFCQSISHVGATGHVALPWNLQSNYFLSQLLYSDSMMVFLGAKYVNSEFVAAHTNEPLEFTAWGTSTDQPVLSNGDCVVMIHAVWRVRACDSTERIACSIDAYRKQIEYIFNSIFFT